MKIQRVLYFLDFPNGFGGAASALLKQALAIRKYTTNIMVTIPLDNRGFAIEEFSERCKEYKLPYSYQKYSTSITTENVDIVGLSEDYNNIIAYIKKFNPDLVHSTQINVCVEMACRKLGIPHIMNVYQCTEYIFPMNFPDIFPHYHICDSYFFLERWRKRLGLDSICIRNACELIERKKEKLSKPRLMCVGNFNKRKNQWELIKAVHQMILEKRFVYVDLIGDTESDYGRRCIEYIEQNHLSKWLRICGYVPYAENEIAKSEALVCCSINESFPNVIEIAMASRTIVISTPVDSVEEILKDNENAYVSSGFYANDLYLAIRRFYDQYETELQERLVANAFQTYIEEFSLQTVSNKLISFYKYVCRDYKIRKTKDVKIEDILAVYDSDITFFNENKNSFQNSDIRRNMLWLIPYIKESLSENPSKELVVWGAGLYGAEAIGFAKMYFPELKIRCVIDKNKRGEYLGYPIVGVEYINWKNSMIWIAFMIGQMDAVQILHSNGLEYHRDFFFLAPMNL